MELNTLKALSAVLLFFVALIGAALSKFASSFAPKIVRVCNALAGGILLAIVFVHMLAECSGELEEPGAAIAVFLTRDKESEAFPLGFALAGVGFLLILSVEVFLPGEHDKEHHEATETRAMQMDAENSESDESSAEDEGDLVVIPAGKSCAAGLSAVFGLCLHSFIEGTATGAADEMAEFSAMFIAIILHKMFAVFSMGSLLLNTVSVRAWWVLMILLSLMTPLGIGLGALLAGSFEGPAAAGLICFAAGTLLCVAVYDMLMPSLILGKGEWKRRSFLASLFGFIAMSILALWS
eukprot:Skav215222  [mRNA]  locus=scaffold341:199680:200564:+ [translate_table: standard]